MGGGWEFVVSKSAFVETMGAERGPFEATRMIKPVLPLVKKESKREKHITQAKGIVNILECDYSSQ